MTACCSWLTKLVGHFDADVSAGRYVRLGSIADASSLARAGGSCQMPKHTEKITHNDRVIVTKNQNLKNLHHLTS